MNGSSWPIDIDVDLTCATGRRANDDKLWMGLIPSTTEVDAKARFRKVYGREPAEVKFTAGVVLVGPIVRADEANPPPVGA